MWFSRYFVLYFLDYFALLVHDDPLTTQAGVYKAVLPFDAGNDFAKLNLQTTNNPTAVAYDVVEDYVYWAGNDIDTGRYIKRDVQTGGATQDESLSKLYGNTTIKSVLIKGAYSDPQPQPQLSFFPTVQVEILVPEVES